MRRTAALAGLAGLIATLALAGCGHDAADREALIALDGDEKGMTREEQIAHVNLAIAMKPERSWYWEQRAGYRTDLRDFASARADIDRAIQLKDRPYARFFRGLVLCHVSAYAAAIADFDTAITRQPQNTQFYRGRSLARAAIGDAAGALRDAEHLVATVPQQAESFHARGVALELLGRDDEALSDFDHALAMRPELAYVAEARARVIGRKGDEVATAAALRKAAEIHESQAGCASCLDPFRY